MTAASSLRGRRHGALSRRDDRVGLEGNGKTCIVHMGQEPAPDVIKKGDTNRLVQGSDVRRDRRGHELPRQKSFKRRNPHRQNVDADLHVLEPALAQHGSQSIGAAKRAGGAHPLARLRAHVVNQGTRDRDHIGTVPDIPPDAQTQPATFPKNPAQLGNRSSLVCTKLHPC